MTTEAIQNEIVEEFSMFDNKQDAYAYIIELGKMLEDLDESCRVEANIIKGCQSKVWITAAFEDGVVKFEGDSDSTLVKGLVGLLLRVYNGKTPQEILDTELFFVEKIGLKQMLSMNRSNGFAQMVKQLNFYALAFKAKFENA